MCFHSTAMILLKDFFLNLKFEKLESSNHVERGKNNKF